MDWDQPLVASRNLLIRLSDRYLYRVQQSISSGVQTEMDPNALGILAYFGSPATLREAWAEIGQPLGVDSETFESVVGHFIANKLLVTLEGVRAERRPLSLERSGFGQLMLHHKMVRDEIRIDAYRRAIEAHVAGRRVLDLGCGSGILSLISAGAGASSVVAVEESRIAILASRLFAANEVESIVELRTGNSLDLELEHRAEVLVHELLGGDPFNENLLRYIDDARRRLLIPGGRLIPGRIEVCCCGIQAGDWTDPEQLQAESKHYSDRYGFDFSPFADELRHNRGVVTRVEHELPGPVLSAETVLYDVDLTGELQGVTDEPRRKQLRATTAGQLNAVLLYFRAHLDESTVLSTAPELPKTHWPWVVFELQRGFEVAVGDTVSIVAKTEMVGGRESIVVELDANGT